MDVEVMVREKPTQTADLEAEWGIAPGAHTYLSTSHALTVMRAPKDAWIFLMVKSAEGLALALLPCMVCRRHWQAWPCEPCSGRNHHV